MLFDFTSENPQLHAELQQELQELLQKKAAADDAREDDPSELSLYSPVYKKVVEIVTAYPSQVVDQESLDKVITFMTGAGDVNTSRGFAALTSDYTARMGSLFFGSAFTSAQVQRASNKTAFRIFDRLAENSDIPTMEPIADDDASSAALVLFDDPDLPDDLKLPTGDSGIEAGESGGPAGWAGSLMSSLVGSDQTARIVSGDGFNNE